MKVAIYARLSEDRGESTSVERQLESCRQLAASRGWTVVAEYSDADLSAFRRGVVRPGYDDMLAHLGDFDTILVWKLDRLVRRFLEFARIWPLLEKAGVALVSANEPIDTSSAIGRIIVLMLVGFAELESETISLRTRARHGELRRQGRWSGGGKRAWGLTADWTGIVEEEAALVREAARRVTAHESLRSITLDFARRGVLSPSGVPWRVPHLRRTLMSPRLVGRREGQDGAGGHIPAILTEDEYAGVLGVLDRHDPIPRTGARSYLLTGFLWCAKCDVKMQSHGHVRGKRYKCRNCYLGIVAGPLEELITEGVLDRVDSPAVALALDRRSAPSGTSQFLEQIRADEQALAELSRARFVDRYISDAEYRVAREPLIARIAQTQQYLQARDGGVLRQAQGKARALWGSADLGWRRALIGAVVDRVTILPATKRGPGLDPSRVEVTLRA